MSYLTASYGIWKRNGCPIWTDTYRCAWHPAEQEPAAPFDNGGFRWHITS